MKRQAILMVDLGYGDAGKGTMTDWLARRPGAHTVVRFNGGAQAGHNVVTPDGRQHVFSQFGSGTFVPGRRTFLSHHTVLKPLAMLAEERHLREVEVRDAFNRTFMDERALVATPFHQAANRLLEIDRNNDRHGSCGMGIGQAVFDAVELGGEAIRLADYRDFRGLRRKLLRFQEWKRAKHLDLIERCRGMELAETGITTLEDRFLVDAYIELLTMFGKQAQIVSGERLGEFLAEDGAVIFEPAQAVLLDRWRGFMPYCTPSVCTFENANELLQEHGYDGEVKRLGLTRAYMVRHGPGPFVSEDLELTERLPDTVNGMHQWQRGFRVGWLDTVALRYAIKCCDDVDGLVVTCLDRLRREDDWHICTAYNLSICPPDDVRRFCIGEFNNTYALRLGPEHDLAYQHELTTLVSRAQPIYEITRPCSDFDQRVADYLATIETELRVPVTVASFGPAASDKRVRPF